MTTPISYPHRTGFAFSFPSLTLSKGPEVFQGLMGFSCTPKIDGEKIIFLNGRTAAARTRGQLMIDGVITMLLDSALDYATAHRYVLDQQNTITASLEDGARRAKLKLEQLRLLELPFDLKGNDGVEVAFKFSAFNLYINDIPLVEGGAQTLFSQFGIGS